MIELSYEPAKKHPSKAALSIFAVACALALVDAGASALLNNFYAQTPLPHPVNRLILAAVWGPLLLRPLGALLVGWLADRSGRRPALLFNAGCCCTILLAACVIHGGDGLIVLSAAFRLTEGGAWAAGATLVIEKAAAKWRGTIIGILLTSYSAGVLLARPWPSFRILPQGSDQRMILLVITSLIVLVLISLATESEVWLRVKERREIGNRHFTVSLATLASVIVLGACLSLTESHLSTTVNAAAGMQRWIVRHVGVFSIWDKMLFASIIGPLVFGTVSDLAGRRLTILLAIGIVLACGGALLQGGSDSATEIVVYRFAIVGAMATVMTLVLERTPDNVRGLLPMFALQCGGSISILTLVFILRQPTPTLTSILEFPLTIASCLVVVLLVLGGAGFGDISLGLQPADPLDGPIA